MADEHQPRERPWDETCGFVRAALEQADANTAVALSHAVREAHRLVSVYHEELGNLGAEPLEPAAFEEWRRFLWLLYDETSKLYKRRASVVPGVKLGGNFESIQKGARRALLQIQDMYKKVRPEWEDRDGPLDELEKLRSSLEATLDALEQLPEVSEWQEVPIDMIAQEPAYVPLVGDIAAGTPILAQESIEDIFLMPRQIVGEGTLFLLHVRGDSMIDAAITDRDMVVVRRQDVVENGETVAALIGDEVTIKIFNRAADGRIWLLPRNRAYEPIPGTDARIMGKVVAVLRRT